jgi:hypothetical protein
MEAEERPLPSEERTPPVMKMYFVREFIRGLPALGRMASPTGLVKGEALQPPTKDR